MKYYSIFVRDWRNQSKYLLWLIKYTKPYIPKITLLIILGLIESSVGVSLAVVSKRIIDSALSGGVFTRDISLYVTMVTATILITAIVSLVSIVIDERFSFGIRKQLYEKIIHSHWLDVTQYHTGDLMTRLTSDAKRISDGIIFTIPTIINLIIRLIITFFVLYYYEPVLALLALTIAPVAALVSVILGKKLKKLDIKVQETESAYRSFLQESLSHLLIVKAFANENYSIDRLTELRENRFYWVKRKNRISVASSTVMSFTFQLGYIAAFTFGAIQVSSGAITYGTMTVFLTLVNRIQSPILQLAKNIPRVVSVLASAGRVMELQNIPLEAISPLPAAQQAMGVQISNLTFGYANDENLFEEASVDIRPNEFVAIVGESGIGKTTLIRLIMSFMSHIDGTITFQNNTGSHQMTGAGTRQFISYVPQGNTLFSGTIRENIRMGRLDATDEEITEALKLSSAAAFISTLPEGINTIIGEKGHGLSEGQAQRIAIARALVRKAPFLILDEATSALDEATEIAVLEGIKQLNPKPTCLLITHRRTVLDYCDRELKIQDRKIIDELLAG